VKRPAIERFSGEVFATMPGKLDDVPAECLQAQEA